MQFTRYLRVRETGVFACACSVAVTMVVAGCTSSAPTDSAASDTTRAGSSLATPSVGPSRSTSAARSPVNPVPTTTVAQPSRGGAGVVVPSRRVTTLPVVPLTADANFGSGVTGQIESVRSVTTTTRLPGEVGGPSIAVTIALTNRSKRAVSVGNVVVDALDSAGAPATGVTASPNKPFSGSIARGKSARAVYVFSMATNRRRPVSVTVNYAAGTPVARFVGNVR